MKLQDSAACFLFLNGGCGEQTCHWLALSIVLLCNGLQPTIPAKIFCKCWNCKEVVVDLLWHHGRIPDLNPCILKQQQEQNCVHSQWAVKKILPDFPLCLIYPALPLQWKCCLLLIKLAASTKDHDLPLFSQRTVIGEPQSVCSPAALTSLSGSGTAAASTPKPATSLS